MTAPEFRHSLSGSSPSERDTALMGVSFLEPVVILDPIDRSVDRLARLRPHGFIQNDIPDFKYMRFCVTERNILPQKKTQRDAWCWSDKLMSRELPCSLGFAGHRARVPPDPIPNSEVKPRSVSGCSVVFGHVNPGKLVTPLQVSQINLLTWRKITQNL
jgi:hypothetical protein